MNHSVEEAGWEDRIRTYVAGARIQSPATRRLPKNFLFISKNYVLDKRFCRDYQKCFFAKALPEAVLRYFSKAKAFECSLKEGDCSNVQGIYLEV